MLHKEHNISWNEIQPWELKRQFQTYQQQSQDQSSLAYHQNSRVNVQKQS